MRDAHHDGAHPLNSRKIDGGLSLLDALGQWKGQAGLWRDRNLKEQSSGEVDIEKQFGIK